VLRGVAIFSVDPIGMTNELFSKLVDDDFSMSASKSIMRLPIPKITLKTIHQKSVFLVIVYRLLWEHIISTYLRRPTRYLRIQNLYPLNQTDYSG
jgi:hypothetical protein